MKCKMYKLQVLEMQSVQVTEKSKLLKYQITEIPNYCNIEMPSYKFLKYRITEMPQYYVTK